MRVLITTLFLLGLPAHADDAAKPEDIASYRHNAMEALGKHMKTSAMIIKGQAPFQGDLPAHAAAIEGLSANLVSWFPEGTGPDVVPKSDALPTVWSDRQGFEKAALTFQQEAAKLTAITKKEPLDLDAFKAQFGAVGKSCGGCHDDFAKEDD